MSICQYFTELARAPNRTRFSTRNYKPLLDAKRALYIHIYIFILVKPESYSLVLDRPLWLILRMDVSSRYSNKYC